MYSVLEIRDLVACSIPNDKDTILSNGVAGDSIQTPDPKPSIKSAPKSVAAYNCIFEMGSSGFIISPTGPENPAGS
ncbi:hypothetical protein D3C87_1546940 [compost metagenome]